MMFKHGDVLRWQVLRLRWHDGWFIAPLGTLAPLPQAARPGPAWLRLVDDFRGPVFLDPTEAVARLDAIDGGEPEGAHGEADGILLASATPEVRAAYERLKGRAPWWATA